MIKPFRHSKSSVSQYLTCARQFYYTRHKDVQKKTDYPRLCGNVVHDIVELLYKPTKEPRPFYFKEKKSLLGYWWFMWPKAVQIAIERGQLQMNKEELDKFYYVGVKCLSNYWDANYHLPRPLQIEQVYKHRVWGFRLIGFFDQLRAATTTWIAKHRPELIVNDRLIDGYDPVIILDLKTEYASYDPTIRKEDASIMDWQLKQFKLHEDIQPTMYTLLYEVQTGKKPVGFVWYHLPTNKWFFTKRDEHDYATLRDQLTHVENNVAAQSFPKNVHGGCMRCDHWQICRENRHFIISRPETPGGIWDEPPELIPNLAVKKGEQQLRLKKLKVERRKVEKLPEVFIPKGPPAFVELPWDDSENAPKE